MLSVDSFPLALALHSLPKEFHYRSIMLRKVSLCLLVPFLQFQAVRVRCCHSSGHITPQSTSSCGSQRWMRRESLRATTWLLDLPPYVAFGVPTGIEGDVR